MMLRTITTWEMFLAAGAATAFMVLYTVRSNWRASVMGRHLMTFMGVLATLLVMWGVGRLTGGPLPLWTWAVALGAFDAVLLWRVVLLWRTQHNGDPAAAKMYGERRGQDPDLPEQAPPAEPVLEGGQGD